MQIPTTDNGVLFADARYNTSGANSGTAGTIKDLLTSNYLDPMSRIHYIPKDAFPIKTSKPNVKKFVRNYIDTAEDNGRQADESMSAYYPQMGN